MTLRSHDTHDPFVRKMDSCPDEVLGAIADPQLNGLLSFVTGEWRVAVGRRSSRTHQFLTESI